MFNKSKKSIKELDSVFQKIEEKEGILETEEEKTLRESKKRETNKIKLVLFILVGLIVLLMVVYTIFSIYENLNGKYDDLRLKGRSELVLVNADETLLSNYLQKGRYTIVTFWASWCPHCQAEASALNKFMIANKNINFIVVSHDKKIEDLQSYFKSNPEYNWFVIFDEGRNIRKSIDSTASTIPRTYLLDDQGNVIDKIEGEASFDGLTKLFEKSLIQQSK